MSKRQRAIQILSIFVTVGFLPAVCVRTTAQQPTAISAPSASTRACSANPVLEPGKQKHAKTKHPLPQEPAPACIEVKGEPLEVQEALQGIAREQQWRIHDNHATEDTWTFLRYLNTDELEQYADTKVLVQPVDFEDGKVAVVVRTSDIGGGYTRVQISTQFTGEGKSSDTTMKQPATSWSLHSKGTLEKEMIASLTARYQHIE